MKDLILDDEFSEELETAMTSGSPFFLRGLIKRDAAQLQERKEYLMKQAHEIEEAIHLPEDESHLLEDMISKGDHDHSVQKAIEACVQEFGRAISPWFPLSSENSHGDTKSTPQVLSKGQRGDALQSCAPQQPL